MMRKDVYSPEHPATHSPDQFWAGLNRNVISLTLVTITCDEQAAAAILEVAQQHYGSTSRVMKSQMKRLGLLKSALHER
jgi:hypothetical protein